MQKVSKRKRTILDVMDTEIEALETRLAKAQPMIDELAQLRKARATLLSERSTTGAVGNAKLTMEMIVEFFRARNNEWAQPQEIAQALGVPGGSVRSHLNRGKDTRYAYDATEGWALIGEEGDEEEDDD